MCKPHCTIKVLPQGWVSSLTDRRETFGGAQGKKGRTWGIIPRSEVREGSARDQDLRWPFRAVGRGRWFPVFLWGIFPDFRLGLCSRLPDWPCYQPSNTGLHLLAEKPLPPFLGLCSVLLRRLGCGADLGERPSTRSCNHQSFHSRGSGEGRARHPGRSRSFLF